MAKGDKKSNSRTNKTSKQSAQAYRKTGDEGLPNAHTSSKISHELQQRCLNIFRDAFKAGTGDKALLQEVKGHLYNRDFTAAFGKEDYLRVYASRWSPSRALGYLQIFDGVADHLRFGTSSELTGQPQEGLNILCFGGGAGSELVALSGLASLRKEHLRDAAQLMDLQFIDIADWTSIINTLHQTIITPPELSKYASLAKKDANTALLQLDDLSVSFQHHDILDKVLAPVVSEIIARADLITVMFTLNELYSTSMPATQALLSRITETVRTGAHLLVVDSPGSYSTVSINGMEKKYPMQWLLDYTLLGPPQRANDKGGTQWKKILSDDSQWYRLPDGLQYPIELENMRYQIHLYRRIADSGE